MGYEALDLETPADAAARHDAYLAVSQLADWCPWAPFANGLAEAPRLPGVYLLRDPRDRVIRYVGMAGERAGSGRPQGLYGRLTVYRTGKGAVSGFGEAALDRALADPDWVASKLGHLRAIGPQRAKESARDAISRLAPEVSWTTCADGTDAHHLEVRVVNLLRPFGLWNR